MPNDMLHLTRADADVGDVRVLDALEIVELTPAERAQAGDGWGERRYRIRFIPIPAFCAVELLCDVITVVDAVVVARGT